MIILLFICHKQQFLNLWFVDIIIAMFKSKSHLFFDASNYIIYQVNNLLNRTTDLFISINNDKNLYVLFDTINKYIVKKTFECCCIWLCYWFMCVICIIVLFKLHFDPFYILPKVCHNPQILFFYVFWFFFPSFLYGISENTKVLSLLTKVWNESICEITLTQG